MRDLLWNLALNSDGLVVGFAAGLILGGVIVAGVAYEAGRRRAHAELAALDRLRELHDETAADVSIVPRWPPNAA